MDVVRRQEANVVTLDVGLPDIDGFEVLRRIRQFSDAYVVMLTARTDELDTLTALHTGADDFMTKPFRPRELRARVAAMMRRPRQDTIERQSPSRAAAAESAAPPQDSVLRHNGLVLNPDSRTVTVDGVPVSLTRSEFDLLHALLKGAGAVRSKIGPGAGGAGRVLPGGCVHQRIRRTRRRSAYRQPAAEAARGSRCSRAGCRPSAAWGTGSPPERD